MRTLAIILCLSLCFNLPAAAATKLFLRASSSSLGADTASGSTGYGCNNLTGSQALQLASTTAGSAVASLTHTPTATAPPCQMADAASYFTWYSAPLASGVTISGNIDFNITCAESQAQLNAGMRMTVKRWNALTGGITETLLTSANTAECNNTRLAIAAAAPTSTAFNAGDRLVFLVEIVNTAGWGGNGARTVTLKVDAASGSLGDSCANFADTISFAADSNNSPAKGFSQ